MSLEQQARRAWGIVRSQGARWVGERLVLEAQKRFGYEARVYRPRSWTEAAAGIFSAEAQELSSEARLGRWRDGDGGAWGRRRGEPAWRQGFLATLDVERRSLLARAEAILAGRFTLFSRHDVQLGFPPDWLANPLRGTASHPPSDRHWSRIGMEGEPYGNLKFVWELSRAPWAFVLARAYAATEDERFAEGFWRLWSDWLDANPPHHTVQWKCGQECALRLIAVSFAVQVFASAAATTPPRFARHLEAMAAHAERIAQGGWYARLQNNNHSISEAAGLYTAGVFYPLLAGAARWRALGWKHLGEEAVRLIRPDGTFTQKSHNYHRLMLHDYLWASSVAELAGEGWDPEAHRRLVAAVSYLEGVVDPTSGEAPNFGNNDGALILPLGEERYGDFRPVLRAATFWRDGVRSREHDESTWWLFGRRAEAAPRREEPPKPPPLALREGGIYTLRQRESWVFTHAEDFRDRPGQADLLHVDLWWRGVAIARDAGTYLYYGDPPSFAWFKSTRCHNTVTVDDLDQMEPGPRFLWASRAHAHVRVVAPSGESDDGGALVMQHDGYHRLAAPVTHLRSVRARGDDTWLVADELTPLAPRDPPRPNEARGEMPDGGGRPAASEAHAFTLHWLLANLPHALTVTSESDLTRGCALRLETPQGLFFVQVAVLEGDAVSIDLVRAAPGPELWGWQSLHYGEKTPALSLRVRAHGPRARLLTCFSPRAPDEPLSTAAWLDDNHLRL